jgi:hypothetical protein
MNSKADRASGERIVRLAPGLYAAFQRLIRIQWMSQSALPRTAVNRMNPVPYPGFMLFNQSIINSL